MPADQERLFLEKLKADESFAREVAGCQTTSARLALAREAGYELASDTGRAHRRAQQKSQGSDPGAREGMCLFEQELWCLRDIVQAACLCPAKRAFHKQRHP